MFTLPHSPYYPFTSRRARTPKKLRLLVERIKRHVERLLAEAEVRHPRTRVRGISIERCPGADQQIDERLALDVIHGHHRGVRALRTGQADKRAHQRFRRALLHQKFARQVRGPHALDHAGPIHPIIEIHPPTSRDELADLLEDEDDETSRQVHVLHRQGITLSDVEHPLVVDVVDEDPRDAARYRFDEKHFFLR